MTEAKSTKETMEALDAIQVVGVEVKKVFKDHKIDLSDLASLANLAKQSPVLIAGVSGADEIPAEAKDFSTEELVAVGMKAIAVLKAIKEA